MPARSDLELDMINYSVTMNKYTMCDLPGPSSTAPTLPDTLEKALSLRGERQRG